MASSEVRWLQSTADVERQATGKVKPLAKIALVVSGHLVAWLIAAQAVAIHMAITAADSQGADGMYAFGDTLLFLGVFGLIALVPTGAALYFLRESKKLWTGLSAMALIISATAPVAIFLYSTSHWATNSVLASLSGFAVLRLLLSPLFFAIFLVCAVLAPASPSRKGLFVASGLDAVAIVYIVVFWFLAGIVRAH